MINKKPFEYLRRMENGEKFSEEIVRNWYIARAYVLNRLKNVTFTPDSEDHLHVVVKSDSPLMLSVVRHVALYAHYINHDESREDESLRNRTVITLISKNPDIKEEMEKEEYLCNLPKYCKFQYNDADPQNADSYIDIEIHIAENFIQDQKEKCLMVFSDDDVKDFCHTMNQNAEDTVFSIDTRMAAYAERIYSLGEMIENLPAEDIHSAKRYSLALNVFQNELLRKAPQQMTNDDKWDNPTKVKECISNIFCADCFLSKNACIQQCHAGIHSPKVNLWEKYNEPLSKSEHARWVVEKLIMGYSPLTPRQRFMDECFFYDMKKRVEFRRYLKKQAKYPSHIDICSYNDLRRIDPDSLKYDSFLMLAIPVILKKMKMT